MNTKRTWWALFTAVPLSLTHCGGSTSSPGAPGSLDGGGDTSVSSGSSSGPNFGSGSSGTVGTTGATSGTVGTTGAGGTGASTGAGGTGAGGTAGATSGTATSGTAGTGASSGAVVDSGPNDPCTNGTYRCFGDQLCDPALGCVQCLSNPNCPPAGAGNADLKVCVLGSCELCGADTDCPTGQVCYPNNHTCHASCTADAGGALCAAGGRTPTCDTATGACVGCVTGADCPARDPVCDPTTQQCTQCATNADCKRNANGGVCDTASDTCVLCLADTDCPAARPICNDATHACVAGCTTNAGCMGRGGFGGRMTPVCDTASGLCVECTTAAQCTGAGATCTNNLCVDTQCNADSDCSADGGGAAPYCEGTRCVACLNRSQCAATDRACTNGVCIP
jgi:hypothetical protein